MARDFATTDRYEIGSAVVTAYPFTMACWFYADSLSSARTLMCVGPASAAAAQQRIYASSTEVGANSEGGGTNANATTTAAPSASVWTHAAGVFVSATDRRAFINGGSKGTNATSVAFSTAINRTVIAQRLRSNVYAQGMDGRLAECAIWNEALSDDDVYSLSRGYRPSLIRPDSLVMYVPMIRDVLDFSGGQTLTATGTPVVIEHTRRIA